MTTDLKGRLESLSAQLHEALTHTPNQPATQGLQRASRFTDAALASLPVTAPLDSPGAALIHHFLKEARLAVRAAYELDARRMQPGRLLADA